MAKKPFKLPPGVKLVGLGKATLSFLLDLAFTAIVMVVLYYSIGIPVILNNSDYSQKSQQVNDTYRNSGLVYENNGNFKLYADTDTAATTPENYAYKKYLYVVWNYFTVVIPGNEDLTVDFEFTDSSVTYAAFKGEVSASNPIYGKWIYTTFLGYNDTAEENNFYPSVENDFTSAPTGNDEKHFLLATMMNDVSTYKGLYPTVVSHLQNQPNLLAWQTRMRLDVYLATVPTFVAPPIIFFFILPLCLPHGKTLGKLILGEAVVGVDGYGARKIQIVIRQFIITFSWLMLALPWQVVSWPLFMLLMLLGYMSKVLSKKSQAFHDMIAGTIPIDSRKSVWFATPEEEQEFVESHPSSPISKTYRAEEREAEDRRTSARIEAEEQILDLSTIDKRRAEARSMTSFDEFEKKSDAEFAAREEALKEKEAAEEEPVDEEAEKAAFKDLAALEGLSEEEAAALAEGDFEDEAPKEEPKKETPEEPEDPDGFTDGAK